jgi:GNAT superfamily N-acetyltransferase
MPHIDNADVSAVRIDLPSTHSSTTTAVLGPASGQVELPVELYVAQSHRRQGIDKPLMQRLCQVAADKQSAAGWSG